VPTNVNIRFTRPNSGVARHRPFWNDPVRLRHGAGDKSGEDEMQDNGENRPLDRRRLLRRAGTVAAGVAGAGVVGAVAAAPAEAANGDPFILGNANTADATSTLTAGNAANPALRLENATGAPLSVRPLATTGNPADPSTWVTEPPSTQAPVGSVYADDFGDLHVIGQPLGGALGPKYANMLYSPTWATMVAPITPIRWVDTRFANLRVHIVPGSANFDSAFRVLPKNSLTVPDMIIDLSAIFAGGFGAVQANLTVLLPVAQGFASLWDAGTWPGTSSINYVPSVPEIANFTQTVIAPDRTIRLKTNRAAQFILDIVGFVMTDPFAQFVAGAVATDARGQQHAPWRRHVPK
jgi:hypothetical protein